MTQPRGLRRRRRAIPGTNIPADLAAWFAGEEKEVPWSALIYPDYDLLRPRWLAWLAEHPGAQPPEGYAWLNEPPPELRHGVPYEQAVEMTEACARRPKGRR